MCYTNDYMFTLLEGMLLVYNQGGVFKYDGVNTP